MGALCGRPRPGPEPPASGNLGQNIDTEPTPGPFLTRQDKELFVIAIDLGTTESRVAYCYRGVEGDIVFQTDLLRDWPGSGERRGAPGKTPTELIFDNRGNVKDWGAGCLNVHKYNDDALARNGWIRSRYFTCFILTTDSQQGDLASLPRLPAGITPVTAWGLYLKELHRSAIEQITGKRGSMILEKCKAAGKLQYVITYPGRWRHDGLLTLEHLRYQAVLAGLVNDPYDEKLTFLPESKASVFYCYHELGATLHPGSVFTVVNADERIIEMTVYEAISLQPALQLSELRARVSSCRGSVSIDEQVQVKIQDYLQANYPRQWTHRHVDEALSNFRKSVKPVFSMNDKDPIYLRAGACNEFENGHLTLEWHDIEDGFLRCVEPIGLELEPFTSQDPYKPSSSVFLVGSLGGSAYLRSYLDKTVFNDRQPKVDLVQPDDLQSGGSQAVVLGACCFALKTSVATRSAQSGGRGTTGTATLQAPMEDKMWSARIITTWAALRPRSAVAGKGKPHNRDRLEEILLGVPAPKRLAFLVDLGLHAMAHGSDYEATIFFADGWYSALDDHVSATPEEQTEMSDFALCYDNQHDFTGSQQLYGRSFATYEYQLQELSLYGGRPVAAEILGYIYLRHLREQPAWSDDTLRDVHVERLVHMYAPLRKHSLFTPALPACAARDGKHVPRSI